MPHGQEVGYSAGAKSKLLQATLGGESRGTCGGCVRAPSPRARARAHTHVCVCVCVCVPDPDPGAEPGELVVLGYARCAGRAAWSDELQALLLPTVDKEVRPWRAGRVRR